MIIITAIIIIIHLFIHIHQVLSIKYQIRIKCLEGKEH